MNRKLLFDVPAFYAIVFSLLLMQSCSKSSGNSDSGNTSGYYLTGTVNGQAWAANVSSQENSAPALAIVTSSGGTSVLLLLGIKAVNKDTSAAVLIFPQTIAINTAVNFDANKYIEGAFVQEISAGSGTYYGYNTTTATGGSGTITVTLFDQSAKIIEGTFSGTFGSQQGRSPVQITGGKFRCPYTTDATKLPKTGVKF